MVNSMWKQYTEEKHWKCSHDQNPEHFLWGPSHIPGLWQLLKHWEIYLVWKYLILIHYQTTLEDHLHRCCKAAVNWRSPNAENKCSRSLKSTQGIVWSIHSTSKIVLPKKKRKLKQTLETQQGRKAPSKLTPALRQERGWFHPAPEERGCSWCHRGAGPGGQTPRKIAPTSATTMGCFPLCVPFGIAFSYQFQIFSMYWALVDAHVAVPHTAHLRD